MPDTKITALTALTAADPANDVLPIVDVSDTTMAASGTTKKISINNVLGCSGTATLASATITGDLTVDTSTLKVDSANNRVGIRTASPSEPLTVDNTSGVTTGAIRISASDQAHSRLSIQNLNGQAYHLVAGNPGTSNAGFALYDNTAGSTRWYVDNTGVHTFQNVGGVAGTAMTLNSTGLGVGVSPAVLLDVQSASAVIRATSSTGTNTSFAAFANTGGAVRVGAENSAGGGLFTGSSAYSAVLGTTGAYSAHIGTSGAVRMTVDSTGNVGIGVTPSAWGANYKAFQIGAQSCLYNALGYITSLNTNAYENSSGQIVRIANGEGTRYVQAGGSHQWFYATNASAGTIGGFTQAMTLDASGNLLVGTTTNTNASRIFSRGTATSSALALQGASGDVALAQLTVGKFDNNTTTSQIFVRFTINDNSGGSGQINANGASQAAFGTFSDSRLKENIVSLPSQLANILSLRPVEFDYKDGSGHQIGFVAQEMQEVYSDAVGEQNGFLTVTGWSKTEARLVSAIKELAAKVQALEAKLA